MLKLAKRAFGQVLFLLEGQDLRDSANCVQFM